MKEALNLSISQKLQQRLSPLQMRFVKMLEMTGPEVEDEVRRELDDNPALETIDSSIDSGDDVFGESAEEMQLADYRDEDEIPVHNFEKQGNYYSDRDFEPQTAADNPTLSESLLSQLRESPISEEDLKIASYLIGNLDDNGYLTRSPSKILDDLAFNAGIDIDREHLAEVMKRVRELEPAGICAFDLRDCLALQLHRMPSNKNRNLALEIVEHYFDLFSMKHFDRLKNVLSVSNSELQAAIDIIRSLNPKPGAGIGESEADVRTRHIIPDFNIEIDGDILTLSLLNNIPELQIEESFRTDEFVPFSGITSKAAKEANSFINRKREEAQDFIDILRTRQETLFNVMSAIMRHQRTFFLTEDESKLKPMRLKDISQATGYDLSVISRACAGKYVSTPGGVYPLKFFFNEGVGDDEEVSSREILVAIKEIISKEDKSHPLSDDAIMKLLHERGYDIARRTVAKYRERASIPVARLRREF